MFKGVSPPRSSLYPQLFVPISYLGTNIFLLAQLSPLTCFFTIHSCGLWKEVFGDTERLGSAVPAAWEERAITLLRSLPLDCRDRQLIVAVLTIPLAEADQAEFNSTHESGPSKKVKKDTAVGVCIQHLLKWPSRELDTVQGIHKGICRFTCIEIQHTSPYYMSFPRRLCAQRVVQARSSHF